MQGKIVNESASPSLASSVAVAAQKARFSRGLLSGGLVLALGFVAGCLPTYGIDLNGNLEFNERLRADTGPTASLPSLRFYSDGGDRHGEIISELTYSTIDPAYLRQLRRSEYLWVENDGYPNLSWELILADVVLPEELAEKTGQRTVDRIGVCGGALNEPETRGLFLEDTAGPAPSPEDLGATVGWTVCTDGDARRDPYNRVGPLDRGCATYDARNLVASYSAPAPFCVIEAPLPSPTGDVSYRLQALELEHLGDLSSKYPNLSARPHPVTPQLKVVAGGRALARPLSFLGSQAVREMDQVYESHAWAWKVPVHGRLWEENFSPNLVVSRARIFAERGRDPETGEPLREYLTPARISLEPSECRPDVDPETGDAAFDLTACGERVTPTYRLRALDDPKPIDDDARLEWVVEFRTYADADGRFTDDPPVKADDLLFIEFEVVDGTVGTMASGLRVAPGGVDFGNVQASSGAKFERALRVLNEGLSSLFVDDVSLTGPDAGDFRVALEPPPQTLPVRLTPLASVDLTLVVQASQYGTKHATVEIKARDLAGRPVQVRATVLVNAVDVIPVVMPDHMSFLRRDDGDRDRYLYERRFLIEDAGSIDLERTDITLSGPHASSFTVVSSEYYSGLADRPPPARRTVSPGGSEIFTVYYHPTSPGDHRAEVHIATNAGEQVVELWGTCWGTCSYAPPK